MIVINLGERLLEAQHRPDDSGGARDEVHVADLCLSDMESL